MNKNSLRVRIENDKKGEQIFKAIIAHPMETGRRRDPASGGVVPADYVEAVHIRVDGKIIIEMMLGEDVSRDPFILFTFTPPLVANQKMGFSWSDNNKQEISYEYVVKFDQSGIFAFSGEKKGSVAYPLTPQSGAACKPKTPAVTQ